MEPILNRGCRLSVLTAAMLAAAGAADAQEAASATPSDRWVLSATAYFWGTQLDGDGAIRGRM